MPILLHSSGIRLTSLTSAPIRSGNSVSGKTSEKGHKETFSVARSFCSGQF
jgi:hypothetical protein